MVGCGCSAGAGKTTLLKILGGKHMVPEGAVSILGRPPFHDTALTSSGDLSYVGGTWVRDVAFAGYSIPLAVSDVQQGCVQRRALPISQTVPHTRAVARRQQLISVTHCALL